MRRNATLPESITHPNMTLLAEGERRARGCTTIVADRVMRGHCDPDRLAAAFAKVTTKHDVLRASMVQLASPLPEDPESWWTSYRLRVSDSVDPSIRFHRSPSDFPATGPLDLSSSPLLRLDVAPTDAGDHRLRVTSTHVIFDGLAGRAFWRDLTTAYLSGDLPAAPVAYAQYLESQFGKWRAGAMEPARLFWRSCLERAQPYPTGSLGRRLSIWPLKKALRHDFDDRQSSRFDEVRRATRGTSFSTAVACLAVAISEVFGVPEVLLLTPAANRTEPDVVSSLGLFANLVYLRLVPGPDRLGIFRSSRDAVRRALANSHYPFPLLNMEIQGFNPALATSPRLVVRGPDPAGTDAGPASSPLFSRVDEFGVAPAHDHGLGVDLLADVLRYGDQMSVQITFRVDRFHPDTIRELLSAWGMSSERLLG